MCMFLQLTSLALNLHHNQKLQFLQRPGLTGSFKQRSGVRTVHNLSYKVVASVSSFVLPYLLNSDKNYTGDWKQRFSSLLCLNGLNLNLLPGWVCQAVPGALCWGSTTVAERNGEEVAWSADPRWMLAPCSSPVLWGVRQAGGSLSLTNHVWVAFLNAVSTTLFCAGSPGSLWGGWQSHCSFRVFVYLLLCSQCSGAFCCKSWHLVGLGKQQNCLGVFYQHLQCVQSFCRLQESVSSLQCSSSCTCQWM